MTFSPKRVLEKLLSRFSSNPEYEKVFPDVIEWRIEFGEDEMPDREIGLNEVGMPILSGPNERNYGFWQDTNMTINDFENEVIEKEYFECKWKEFYGNHT